MTNEKVYNMLFRKIYTLLVDKAVRKGRTAEEVNQIITWLTGYTAEEIEQIPATATYSDFSEMRPSSTPIAKRSPARSEASG